MRHLFFLLTAVVCACVVGMSGCMQAQPPAAPPAVVDVSITAVSTLPTDPDDAAWKQATEFVAKLMPQDMVEPRELKVTTAEVRIRALGNGDLVSFRMEWLDATINDIAGPALFSDGCAVQVPTKADPSLPAPQMGENGKRVEIAQWKAAWQAMVNGREDNVKALHPNAAIDHYPFEAAPLKGTPEQKEMSDRYAPARSLGNPMSGPRSNPVQDLIAEGPGTITFVKETLSRGSGKRTAAGTGWAVVITRRLPEGFNPQVGSSVAFAVFEGSEQEVGARKMRTAWIPLTAKTGGKP